jgi:hypothetical protein
MVDLRTILANIWLLWLGLGYIGGMFCTAVYRQAGSKMLRSGRVFHLTALVASVFGLVWWAMILDYVEDPYGTLYYIRYFVMPADDRD